MIESQDPPCRMYLLHWAGAVQSARVSCCKTFLENIAADLPRGASDTSIHRP